MKRIKCLAGLLLIAAMLTACTKETVTERPVLLAAVNANVDIAVAECRDLMDITAYDGYVLADPEEISFEIDGYLHGVYVSAGQQVEEGEVIAALVGADYNKINNLKEEIENLETQNESRFTYLQAELELERLAGADTAELEMNLRHEKELAELKLEEKKQRLAAMEEKDPGYIYVTAPRDCTVMAVTSIRTNGFISAGSPVCVLEAEEGIKLTCPYIDEKTINNSYDFYAIINGEQHRITYIPWTKDELKTMSANEITPVSVFTFDEEDIDVTAGDYVAVITISNVVDNVLSIPVNAVYSDSTGKYVYKVVDNVRTRQQVKLGISNSTYVEVVDGLQEGDGVYVKN